MKYTINQKEGVGNDCGEMASQRDLLPLMLRSTSLAKLERKDTGFEYTVVDSEIFDDLNIDSIKS